MTSFENVQQVLDNFDFDYISVALYKNNIYGEKEASLSWRERKVLSSKTTNIYRHRFIKTLKKRICMPLYKVKNACIRHKEVNDLSHIVIIPMIDKEITSPIDFT